MFECLKGTNIIGINGMSLGENATSVMSESLTQGVYSLECFIQWSMN